MLRQAAQCLSPPLTGIETIKPITLVIAYHMAWGFLHSIIRLDQ